MESKGAAYPEVHDIFTGSVIHMSTIVRNLTIEDSDDWHRLWDGYCAFYETDMPAEVTSTTWKRLTNPDEPTFSVWWPSVMAR